MNLNIRLKGHEKEENYSFIKIISEKKFFYG